MHACSNKSIFVLIRKSWTRFISCSLQTPCHFPDNIFRQFLELRVIIPRPASRNVGFRHFTMSLLKLTFRFLTIKPVQQFLNSKVRVLITLKIPSGKPKSFCNSVIIRIIVFILQTQKINIPLLFFHCAPFSSPVPKQQYRGRSCLLKFWVEVSLHPCRIVSCCFCRR